MSQPLSACMHVTYVRNKFDKSQDALIVKERILDPITKQEKPSLKIVRNYECPFYVVKKGLQTYKQKKEWEHLENLDVYSSSKAQLPNKLKKILGVHTDFAKLKELCRSPYVYGTDVSASVLYKKNEEIRADKFNGNWKPTFTLAVADYETDTVKGHEQIISGAIAHDDHVFVVVTADFLQLKNPNASNIESLTMVEYAKLQQAIDKHLKKHIQDRNLQVKLKIVRTAYDCAKAIMMAAHKLMPDLLVFWNMQFDINKMLDACAEAKKEPESIFCDPRIPDDLKTFDWKEDKLVKIKADGSVHRKHPAELWNVVTAPATFYIIDAMVVFKMLRVVEGMRQSYSLDSILKDEEIGGKLQIPEAEGYVGLDWHRHMQRNYKIEYLVYNQYDVISILDLDKKTGDLETKLAMYADGTELPNINSNPRRLSNNLHFFLLERGKVPAGASDDMTEEGDEHLLGRNDWTLTLANELAIGTGIPVFNPEWGEFISRIATMVADIDIASGYPIAQVIHNISKSTTLVEVCSIFGLTELVQRRIGVNLTYVPANAVDISATVLGTPRLEEWVDMMEAA